MEPKTVNLPYLYFMDTLDLSNVCPILGQENITDFNIVYDNNTSILIHYKPADIPGCTRSIVFFSQSTKKVESDHFFSRTSWKFPEAHLFFVNDPYYFKNFIGRKKYDSPIGYYMLDFKGWVPLIHPILLKFHELLGIAFCKLIGSGDAGYSALQFGAIFEEIAPWTLTIAINPPLYKSLLNYTDVIDKINECPIDWSLDMSKIKTKVEKGKHLFYVVQDMLDEIHYKESYLKFKQKLKENGIQGWTFTTPVTSFYNKTSNNYHTMELSKEITFDFLDWMSNHIPSAESNAAVHKLIREF
jgi:hypothetical protein